MEERREGTHEPGRDIDANSSLDIRFFLFLLLIVSLNSSWSLESLVALLLEPGACLWMGFWE